MEESIVKLTEDLRGDCYLLSMHASLASQTFSEWERLVQGFVGHLSR